jgi:hypothetical protein
MGFIWSQNRHHHTYNIEKKRNILPACADVQKHYLWMEKLNNETNWG